MTYLRRLIIALIIFIVLSCAWVGAEMLIYGNSPRSVVDTAIAICIALSISEKIEKGVEESERKREFADKFAREFFNAIKKGSKEEACGGNRDESQDRA